MCSEGKGVLCHPWFTFVSRPEPHHHTQRNSFVLTPYACVYSLSTCQNTLKSTSQRALLLARQLLSKRRHSSLHFSKPWPVSCLQLPAPQHQVVPVWAGIKSENLITAMDPILTSQWDMTLVAAFGILSSQQPSSRAHSCQHTAWLRC